MAAIDIEKAFDYLPRDVIWKSFTQRGINSELINVIASTYNNTRNYVRTSHIQSEFVTMEDYLTLNYSI